jgi:nitrite reductase/ring-hydroxylating ferredoxin subunit
MVAPTGPPRLISSTGACRGGDLAVRTYPVREEDGEIVVDV